MPKNVKSPKKSLRSLSVQVETFGFSVDAIQVMQKIEPKLKPKALIRKFASYLHLAESKEEFKWIPFAGTVLGTLFDSKIIIRRVRAYTFKLPGGEYTPDFNYVLEDGTQVHVEVKGSKFMPSYRDSQAKQKAVATIYYEQKFIQVMPNKNAPNGWEVLLQQPDKEYGALLQELSQILTDNEGILE